MSAPLTDAELAEIEARVNAATAGPWGHEVDCFDTEEGIVVTVSDAETTMLATIDANVSVHRPADAATWTDADSRERDARWALAKRSQAATDAAFIASARQDIPRLLSALRDARAQCAFLATFITSHASTCAIDAHHDCDCGLDAALKETT